MTERYSPLHQLHVDAGATFTDFAGWQMPMRYHSELAEHHAVRTAAGIFDVSHMGEITMSGGGAASFLDYALTGKLSAMQVMQAKYTLLLDERGGILDDVIVYRVEPTSFLVVANAGNREQVLAALTARSAGHSGVAIVDSSDDTALIAVQGPNALPVLERTTSLTAADPGFAHLGYYRATSASYAGNPVLVARTGYTGEDGFELFVRHQDAAALWRALIAAGAPLGLIPAGLASRDTLRLEAGMPLYGHELGPDVLPVQAGLDRVVSLTKDHDFVGRTAVVAGPGPDARVLVGLRSEGRRAGRAGYPVHALDSPGDTVGTGPVVGTGTVVGTGPVVGTVTSGALSPTLGFPIAMAYVDPDTARPGTRLAIDVRGTRVPASVVSLPFYHRRSQSKEGQHHG